MNKDLKHLVLSKYPDVVYKMLSVSRLDYAMFVLGDYYCSSAVCDVLKISEAEYDNLEEIAQEMDLLSFVMPDVVSEARKIAHAYVQRKIRLKKRIQKMFDSGDPCYFLTLTFNDDSLKLKPEVRRKYVSRYLKSVSNDFVANIDFGDELSREHYHAVVQWNGSSFRSKTMTWKGKQYSSWGYGFLGVELCGKSAVDNTRLAKYVAKLTNHAFKESAVGSSMIYARSTNNVNTG